MTPIEPMAESPHSGADADLQAFEAMRKKLEAEGISQETPKHLPGLMALFRRAGLLRDESNDTSVERPTSSGNA